MADTRAPRPSADRTGATDVPEPTGWTGWVAFASTMMVLLGTFQAIEGFVAIFDDGYYRVTQGGLVLSVDYTAWGWFHLLLGVLIVICGIGVMAGNLAARTVAVLLAGLSAIANLLFIEAYPLWSIIVITVDVLVIYALTVHGREMKSTRW
jgi:dolichyl-phosphate-mannose--protein O-mannosyl transferase